MLYVSVTILLVMELSHIKFCIFEHSREATILQVKPLKNRFRKDNSFSKKNCRLYKLLLTLVVTFVRQNKSPTWLMFMLPDIRQKNISVSMSLSMRIFFEDTTCIS